MSVHGNVSTIITRCVKVRVSKVAIGMYIKACWHPRCEVSLTDKMRLQNLAEKVTRSAVSTSSREAYECSMGKKQHCLETVGTRDVDER